MIIPTTDITTYTGRIRGYSRVQAASPCTPPNPTSPHTSQSGAPNFQCRIRAITPKPKTAKNPKNRRVLSSGLRSIFIMAQSRAKAER